MKKLKLANPANGNLQKSSSVKDCVVASKGGEGKWKAEACDKQGIITQFRKKTLISQSFYFLKN